MPYYDIIFIGLPLLWLPLLITIIIYAIIDITGWLPADFLR